MLIIKKAMGLCAVSMLMSSAWAGTDWDYQQPEKWNQLNASFAACAGQNQSPINIENTVKADLAPLKFSYNTLIQTITNNGHTVQVDFKEGGELSLDGDTFKLKQFHLHTPSENTIKGKQYPLEIHFVHANAQGQLAVVGMMYEQGAENPQLAKIWNSLPKQKGQMITLKEPQSVNHLLPKNLDYYRFSGSLTTPPCSEGVRWLILKDIQTASAKQIADFAQLLGHPNNRPVQPLNGRVIVEN